MPRLGSVRIGQQKEPIGFSTWSAADSCPSWSDRSTRTRSTAEHSTDSLPASRPFAITVVTRLGVIQTGIFKPVNNVYGFSTGDGDYSATARVTRLLAVLRRRPLPDSRRSFGRQATAVSQAGVPGRIQTFRTRDAIRSGLSADWPVPAGIALFGDDMQWLNTELVMVRGPWTLQSEYLVSLFHDASATFAGATDPNVTYHGGYIQLFRFLTDDYDHYDKKKGFFERVKPLHSYRVPVGPEENACKGIGAVQVGARYNYLDLVDSGLNGGKLHNMTFGVNWFLNPNMKLQGNYIFTCRDVSETANFPAGSGWIHGFGGRIAIDF